MSHANAALTPRQRLRIAQLIIDQGWAIAHAADYFHVAWPTAQKWARRYAELSIAGMTDRSSRPHTHPNQTPRPVVRKIIHLRLTRRLGPVEIAGLLGMPSSTVHAVLVRERLNRLSHIDRRTGELARRYEHEYPGSLIHVDERAETAIGVLKRAVSWFQDRGVRVERVLSDNGPAYRSHAWRNTCRDLGVTPKRTRPYRPQTNGKIERFHRTLADGWAYSRHYSSEHARRKALPAWLHYYNQHRSHSAIGKVPPVTRLSSNVPGQYS